MTNGSMTIDVDKCTGCYACFLACRDEFTGNDYLPFSAAQPPQGQSWIRVIETERGSFPKLKVSYTPIMCQQCEDAPCIEVATGGAVYRRADGIVIIDPEKAKGQKAIAESCPYGAIFWNDEKNLAQKCTFCAHLLECNNKPRCVEACPVEAIQFGDALMDGEILNPEFGLNPAVCYSGLPKKFITGEIVFNTAGEQECAPGINVVLKHATGEFSTVTDAFGDFEFDGLAGNTDHTIIIQYDKSAPIEINLRTETDVNLGVIEIG